MDEEDDFSTRIAEIAEARKGKPTPLYPLLVWTDAKPTVPGLYLWRFDQFAPMHKWELIVVIRNFTTGKIVQLQSDGTALNGVLSGQFAGPIPQPEEPR